MVLNEGDIIQPLIIKIPTANNTNDGKIGQLKISGSKLYIFTTVWELVTSA